MKTFKILLFCIIVFAILKIDIVQHYFMIGYATWMFYHLVINSIFRGIRNRCEYRALRRECLRIYIRNNRYR